MDKYNSDFQNEVEVSASKRIQQLRDSFKVIRNEAIAIGDLLASGDYFIAYLQNRYPLWAIKNLHNLVTVCNEQELELSNIQGVIVRKKDAIP